MLTKKRNPIIIIALLAALAVIFTYLVQELRATFGSYSSPTPAYSRTHDGLIAHWKMDESSWATTSAYYVVKDYVGGNHLTPKGSASSSAGHYGNGGKFGSDAGGDYLCTDSNNDNTCDDDANNLDLTDAITISAWIKFETLPGSNYPTIVSKSSDYTFEVQGDKLKFNFNTGDWVGPWNGATTLTSARWYHVVVTYDRENVFLYLDGTVDGQGSATQALRTSTNDLTIGYNVHYFDGSIDDVKIWNRALSADEVMRQYVEGPGPVGWWSFESASSTGAIDYSGYGNDGVLSGGMNNDNRVPGKVGKALSFDGGSEYVSVSDDDSLDPGLGDWSGEAWVKWNGTISGTGNIDGILGKNIGTDRYYMRVTTAGAITVMFFDATHVVTSDSNITDLGWHYIAFTADRDGNLTLYIDGVSDGTPYSLIDILAEDIDNSNAFTVPIANLPSLGYFNGSIDDVRVYNYALTPRQIAMNYNGGEPVGYWTFDDGQGNTAKDSSINENHGEVVIGTGGDQVATSTAWLNGRKGKIGQALRFDGTDDYVEVGDDGSLQITAGTLEAWIYASSFDTFDGVVSYITNYNTGYPGYAMGVRDGGLAFILGDDAYDEYFGKGTISINIWYHIATTFDGSTMKGYIDGVEVYSESQDRTVTFSAGGTARIGTFDSTQSLHFNGFIDDVRIYNYARTPEEIRKDYNENKGIVLGSAGNKGYERSDGLISHWKFDESSWATTSQDEAVALDSVGGNHGAPHFDASTTAGKFGNAGKFDGDDDYVEIADDDSLDITDEITVEAWFKTNDANEIQLIVTKYGGTSSGPYELAYDGSNGLRGQIMTTDDSTWTPAKSALSTGTWYHGAMTYDGSDIKIYLNGEFYSSASLTGSINTTALPLRIGVRYPGIPRARFFNGLIDDVKIWNKALSADEVMLQYVEGPGPVGWWSFESASSTGAIDYSGYGNDGALSGGMNNDNRMPGKIGKAMSFDGGGEYVDAGDDNSLNITGEITLSAWVRATNISACIDVNKCGIFGKSSSYDLELEPNGFRFTINDDWGNTDLRYIGSPANNTWYYVVATYDKSVMKLYVDGLLSGSLNATDTINSNSNLAFIGRGSAGSNYLFNGLIDNPKIYNYALTPSQIAQNYNGGAPIAYWSFDENNASSTRNAADDGRNAADLTGTLTGEGWRTAGKVNSAILFDGDDDVVTVGADSRVDLKNKAEYSVSAWIKPNSATSTDNGVIFQKGSTYFRAQDDASGNIHLLGNIDLATTDAQASSTQAFQAGDWTHVMMTFASTSDVRKVKLYIDGIPALKDTDTAGVGNPTDDSASTLYIGGDTSASFDGMIDEVKIYLYELTPEQVRKEYNLNKGIELGTSKNKGYERSDGLISHWKMDESWATSSQDEKTVIDYVGSNHGIAKFDASTTAGKFGNAGKFDGDEDYVDCGKNSSLELINTDFTYSAWIKPSTIAPAYLNVIAKDVYYKRALNVGSGHLRANTAFSETGANSQAANIVQADIWQYVVAVFTTSDNIFKLYYNGQEVTNYSDQTAGVGTPTSFAANSLVIGGINYFDGQIDDVKIWNRALSADEVMRQYVEGPGPVGWWDFDEGKGSSANDKSGYGNTGTLTNMEQTDWVVGKKGRALKFDGDGEYVDVGDKDNLDPTQNISLEAWINIKAGHVNHPMVIGKQSSPEYWFGLHMATTNLRLGIRAGGDNWGAIESDDALLTNEWIHVVGTYDGTTMRIYQSGVEIKNAAHSVGGLLETSADSVRIGAGSGFNGSIDDVRIYNYALTQRQIAMAYNGGEPVGHWTFDEGAGQVAFDSSVNENNGEVVIGTTGDQTATSSAWLNGQAGVSGGAMSFDGTDDYVDCGTGSSLISIADAMTVELWIKYTDLAGTPYFISGDNNKWILHGITADSTFRWYVDTADGTNDVVSDVTSPNTWYHFAVVYDKDSGSNNQKIYINGILKNSDTHTGALDSSSSVYMGYHSSGSNFFNGLIDDVRIYNYARTPEEIRNDYNGGMGIHFR